MWPVCLIVLGVVFLFCGLAICRAAGAITEQEIEAAKPKESDAMPKTPWKDPATTIVLSAVQQAELMRIYREEYVEQCIWPEMPLLAFLRAVEDHQRPDKPIEVELLFAQRHLLRVFANDHQLSWLRYAIDRAIEPKEQLT